MQDSEREECLNELAGLCHAIAKNRGWYFQNRHPLELLCLIHSEISEACEAFRNGNPECNKPSLADYSEVELELADAMIRILDMCGHMEYDIGGALVAKMRYNQSRDIRHGGKVY